ncbi:ABC transporter ATP-binding protein [Tissierella sp. Yu-01]|uniref:ABC transporter ATP-binding protein n=1 Tax=Tissierella sp. Yu-01 TaxID=3035694 RepID=UPI00240D217C|nr:ABC transporter ATP-binding protein [Tissierella sp. Yu-01]WFA08113.1 ABC transporter ATP-binding protein [Tissierella sp. Yu-01]
MLEVRDLSKEFFMGFKLDNISLNLKPGYIMGLIGPTGSGKSTLIKLIMNLIKKDSGEIRIFGEDHIEYEKEIKDRIGFVYDESVFYENLTIDTMKNIIAPFYSKWDDDQFYHYLERLELKGNYVIKKMSKGMKMKFSVAMALSHNAELIIMDEPTSGLDPVIRREFLDILYEIIQDQNKSIIFSSHITTDLEKVADYITYIKDGRLVFSGSKDEIMNKYAIVKGDVKELNDNLREAFLGLRETNVGFEGLTEKVEEIREEFTEPLIERPSLEDIMYYTRGRENGKYN